MATRVRVGAGARGDGWALLFLNLFGWAQVVQVLVPAAVGAMVFRAARRRAALAVAG